MWGACRDQGVDSSAPVAPEAKTGDDMSVRGGGMDMPENPTAAASDPKRVGEGFPEQPKAKFQAGRKAKKRGPELATEEAHRQEVGVDSSAPPADGSSGGMIGQSVGSSASGLGWTGPSVGGSASGPNEMDQGVGSFAPGMESRKRAAEEPLEDLPRK